MMERRGQRNFNGEGYIVEFFAAAFEGRAIVCDLRCKGFDRVRVGDCDVCMYTRR